MSRPPGRSALAASDDHFLERPEIDERVGRHDHVERAGGVAQIGGQFTLDQFVVDLPGLRLSQHARGQIDAHQPARVRRDERTAQAGAASGIEHVEALRGARRSESASIAATSAGRAVHESGELGVEAAGEAIERHFDERVRGPRRDVAARARRDHVAGNGMVRFLLEPFLEDGHRFVDFAERAVRQRQQPPGFGVLRPEGDDLAEADDGFAAFASGRSAGCPRLV